MISFIQGEVLAAGTEWVVVGVHGLGLRVEIPARLSGVQPGAHIELHTQLMVREDSLMLYGFATSTELHVFGILCGVSGVGPRSALGLLSVLTPSQIAQAVHSEDDQPFRRVSGIGQKTAKLLVVQLSGKLAALLNSSDADSGARGVTPASAAAHSAVVEQGLIGLGYSESEARRAVLDARAAGVSDEQAELLRAALALLHTPTSGVRSTVASTAGDQ